MFLLLKGKQKRIYCCHDYHCFWPFASFPGARLLVATTFPVEDEQPVRKRSSTNPSSITWVNIEDIGIVPEFTSFIRNICSIECSGLLTATCCEESVSHFSYCLESFNGMIERDNEEFTMLTFALFMSHVAQHFYKLKLLPVVKPCPSDRRHEKKSDYTLVKLNNARTVFVCELLAVMQRSLFPRIGTSLKVVVIGTQNQPC